MRDGNILAAFVAWYNNLYSNVGMALARQGIRCAVISYRLANPPLPVGVAEIVLTHLLSFLVVWLLLSALMLLPVFVAGMKVSDTLDYSIRTTRNLM